MTTSCRRCRKNSPRPTERRVAPATTACSRTPFMNGSPSLVHRRTKRARWSRNSSRGSSELDVAQPPRLFVSVPDADWPWTKAFVVIAILFAAQATTLYLLGQPLICVCGYITLFVVDVWSSQMSQQLMDWYSFSHIIHGFIFYGLLWLI